MPKSTFLRFIMHVHLYLRRLDRLYNCVFPLEIRHVQLFGYLMLTKVFSSQENYEAMCLFIAFILDQKLDPQAQARLLKSVGFLTVLFSQSGSHPPRYLNKLVIRAGYSFQDGWCSISHSCVLCKATLPLCYQEVESVLPSSLIWAGAVTALASKIRRGATAHRKSATT